MLIGITVCSLALAVFALWRIAQRRKGRTAIARWQLALWWIALCVFAVSFLLMSAFGGEAPAVVLLTGWCAIGIAAVVLQTWAWIEHRIARRTQLELAIVAAPKPPNEITCLLEVAATGVAFMLLALPWLYLTNPALPTSTLIAASFIGLGLGVALVLAKILRYRTRLRDHQILAEGIQRLRDATQEQ